MLVYNVVQFFRDYDSSKEDLDTESFMTVYSFRTHLEAIEFTKQARKTQKEDNSKYSIEITDILTVEEALNNLDFSSGRINDQKKVSNYV
jgi:hypothetical protein